MDGANITRESATSRARQGNTPRECAELTSGCREDIPANEGFPVRQWSIRVFVLGPDGEELAASLFDKVTYKLHPTFANPTRVIKKPPFMLQEQGWGEFDMEIVLHAVDKGGDHAIHHDLNFQKPQYEAVHTVVG